jgi:hypothetical protein
MAESKSSFFRIFINGHSEKSREFNFNSIRRLADISECQHQIERGEFLPHVGARREIGRRILADRGMRAAAGFDAGDAIRNERAGTHQIFRVPLGVDALVMAAIS